MYNKWGGRAFVVKAVTAINITSHNSLNSNKQMQLGKHHQRKALDQIQCTGMKIIINESSLSINMSYRLKMYLKWPEIRLLRAY